MSNVGHFTTVRLEGKGGGNPMPGTKKVRATQPFNCHSYGVCTKEYRVKVLRAAREALGLTLEDLAQRMGCSRSALSNFEALRYPLSVDRLAHYAQVVNVPWEALTPPPPLVTGTLPADPTHPLRRLVAFAQASSPQVVKLVIELLEYHATLSDCPLRPDDP